MALDPRIRQITETVNGQLTERTIRHAVYLERFKTQEVHKIVGMLNRDVLPDLLNQLEHRLNNIATRGIDTSVTTTQRLKYLTRSVHDTLREGFVTAHNGFKTDLIDLAHYEAEFTAAMVKQAVPFTIDFITPNRQLLRSIVTSRPMEGQLLRKWFSGLAGSTQTAVTRQLNIGLALGESVPDMMRRFRGTRAAGFQDGIVGGTRRQVEALVRTGTSHVVNHARMETYKENVDVLKGYQWVSTLDHRTSPICRSLDGKVYAFDADGKEAGPVPPAHFNCRSTTVPLTKSWEELGISGMKEPPAGTRAARQYTAAKESMRGEVPATQTYGDWLHKQPKAVQMDILGKSRFKMFDSRRISIDQFVDPRGKMLTLKQLSALESN